MILMKNINNQLNLNLKIILIVYYEEIRKPILKIFN